MHPKLGDSLSQANEACELSIEQNNRRTEVRQQTIRRPKPDRHTYTIVYICICIYIYI